MAWIYLILAGLCEIGWPIGLKLGWTASGVAVVNLLSINGPFYCQPRVG